MIFRFIAVKDFWLKMYEPTTDGHEYIKKYHVANDTHQIYQKQNTKYW